MSTENLVKKACEYKELCNKNAERKVDQNARSALLLFWCDVKCLSRLAIFCIKHLIFVTEMSSSSRNYFSNLLPSDIFYFCNTNFLSDPGHIIEEDLLNFPFDIFFPKISIHFSHGQSVSVDNKLD